ncbi:hypothetical protein OSB04_024571 [Centaurea solstitialis]|uniref:Integrase catalytic domain-containing protein n=1 Tax=Centaurea solstitialis TaxID=347529 RepID=A0AA38WC73_9ASTR|nr:hypothetical protein OSB04_024571 [Centaurea solstitialis]
MALQAKDNYFDIGSTRKPPRFNKDNFALWKTSMELFLSGADPQIPYFLERGPHVPTQTVLAIPAANGQPGIPAREMEKTVTDWNDEDRRFVSIDTKARSLIAMSLPDDKFHFVCHLRSAKEIWNTLCVQYEDTAVLMESRKIFLVRQYECFIHQKDETLSQTHQRFNCLLIDLKTIGTIYSNSEVITKFMDALPEHWEIYTTCLTMSKDIKTLTLSELYGILLNCEEQKKLKKNLIRETKDPNSTSLALVSDSVPLGKGHFATDCSDWDDVSSDESSDEEDTQVALMVITEEPTLALMAKIEEVPEEAPAKAPEASTSVTESSIQVPSTYVPLESLTQLDLMTIDLYKALNGKTSVEKINIDLRDQLKECHEKIKQLTILEENYKDQVSVNQTLCIEREKALAAKERALAELNAEKVTIKGWSDASEKVDEILASGRNVKNKKSLGFTPGCPRPNRSMLKFGMFVSSIPNPNAPKNIPSSSNSHTEGAPKSKKKTVKEKSQTVSPSKTKNPKPKNKVLGGGPSVSGTKSFSQIPNPRLKIDLKQKAKEKKPIPPLSDAKGVLGPGPTHLNFKDFLDPTKRFLYRKYYHYGLNDHIASKCPDATKAEKSATVKKNPKAAKSAKGKKVFKTVPLVKTPATKTDKSVEAATDSTKPTDNSGSIKKCKVKNKHKEVILTGARKADVYIINMNTSTDNVCFVSRVSTDINWLWHKPCEKGKQTRTSFKSKKISSISFPLHLLHIDLFGPVNVQSIGGKKYTLVIVDEYSRYTWVFFLRSKSDAPEEIILFVRKMEKLNNLSVCSIRSDHGTEFKNSTLETFFNEKGISQNFSSVRTPQQNGVAER